MFCYYLDFFVFDCGCGDVGVYLFIVFDIVDCYIWVI